MKKMVLTGVFSAVIAVLVGGGAAFGVVHYMKSTPTAATASTETPADELDEHNSIFVSLPETVVTLHDEESEDHYMLIELAMVADNKEESDKIKADEPLYQSIAVDTLSDMKYESVRKLKISEIRSILAKSLSDGLKARKIPTPYKDVLVKKVVFQ